MNPFKASDPIENAPKEGSPAEVPPAENLSGLFVWITMGALLVGSLPYMFPAGST
jgi:hypothetical protein